MGNKLNHAVSDEVAYKVYSTLDYDKFKYIDGNRDVEHLSNLRKSIKEHGWYRQPILVNERFEIIEGQHRFVVCKENDLPIEYIVQNGLRATDCAPLNTGRTNWRARNYVHLHSMNSVDYMYFEELLQRFKFSARVTYVATGKSLTGGGVTKVLNGGTLKCNSDDYEKGCRNLQWLSQFNEDIKREGLRGTKDALFTALIFAKNSKSISVAQLTDRVHRNFSRYGKSIADMTDAIEKTNIIYNYKCKVENTVDLVSEYRLAARRERVNESKAES